MNAVRGLLLRSPWRYNKQMDVDFPLLSACLVLMAIGLVMIASASAAVAEANPRIADAYDYFTRHLIYILIALVAGGITLLIPMSLWQRLSGWLLLVAFAGLVLVLVPGIGLEVNGAKRWISIGFLNIQPSELAKLFMVVFLAGFLVRRKNEVKQRLRGILKPIPLVAAMGLLLLAEPDYGAAVVLAGTVAVMLYLAGVRLMLSVPLLLLLLLLLVNYVGFEQYHLARITSFANPWEDQYGSGYQLTQ